MIIQSLRLMSVFLALFFINPIKGQKVIEKYQIKKNDSLRIGPGNNDFFPFINEGYTIMLPKSNKVNGILIFLEDSGYDRKNKSAKQIYDLASKEGYSVLSVSTEIPFDFYFSKPSFESAHKIIRKAFKDHKLPNQNVFFLGAGLVGHRAMKYIEFTKENHSKFQLNLKGIVICNFTMDWTRKWHQHKREMRIKKNNLFEAQFINYMLETHLKGTPEIAPKNYHQFSSYSYFDKKNRNIKHYKNLAVRTYIEPDIKYKFTKYTRTLYENNTTDMVGFMAELDLAGNKNTELIVLEAKDNSSEDRSTQATWDKINKEELISWIVNQSIKR